MKKVISVVLAICMLFCSVTVCVAATSRASTYFDSYLLGLSAQGNGEMAVGFTVYGTTSMQKIGAYSILIEEEIAEDKWIPFFTVYGSSDPSTFYSTGTSVHTGGFTFTGVPGIKYRAVMVAYASNSSGSAYSNKITSAGKVCK